MIVIDDNKVSELAIIYSIYSSLFMVVNKLDYLLSAQIIG